MFPITEKIDLSAAFIVMASEGPPYTSFLAACCKIVDAGLRRHDGRA